MVGRQRAAPGKCIGSNSLSRAEGDVGRGLSTPIVARIIQLVFFFNDAATTEIYTLSLHNALPIYLPLNHTGEPLMSTLEPPLGFRITALPCWRNQWRSQLIGTGYLDTTW